MYERNNYSPLLYTNYPLVQAKKDTKNNIDNIVNNSILEYLIYNYTDMTERKITDVIEKWEEIESRIWKIAKYIAEALRATQEEVHRVLRYTQWENLSTECLERSQYMFQLFQAIEAIQIWETPYENTLHRALKLDMVWLDGKYPEWTTRRDIILTWNMEDIQKVCETIFHIYYGDFS